MINNLYIYYTSVSSFFCVLYKMKYQITFVRQSNRTFDSIMCTILHANLICCYMRLSVGYETRNSHDAFVLDFVETLAICPIIENGRRDSFVKEKLHL